MPTFDYVRFFPYKNVRPEQDSSINFALDSFLNKGKKFVILELGTGCGKSAIGLTVSRYINSLAMPSEFDSGSYVLTTQKVLQEQYIDDFGPPKGELISIKSASNYQCEFHTENTCGESLRLVQNAPKGSQFWNKCMGDCRYKREKKKFLESTESITNYSYFLAETMYGGKITPRDLLILDEAHNCEAELSKFIEVVVSEKFAKDILKLEWPKATDDAGVVKWIRETYEPKLASHLKRAQEVIDKLNMKDKLDEFKAISTQIEVLDKHICKIHRFLEMWSEDNWVMNIIMPLNDRSMKKFEFKPVDVGPYSNELLFKFGKHVLMLSATIVNKDVFCQSLGIKQDDVEFISIDSPFPVENRPIYYVPVGNMNQGAIDDSLPKLVEMIRLLLDQHKGQKGIIHTHTFKIATYIKNNIKSSRLISHDSTNRDAMVQKHMNSTKGTVLLSPSLSEGIDLKDDLSRFQIICKIPYPYLGDKLVKKRMSKQNLWYPFQTAKTIVQSVGRSIRNENDHAVTYITDGNWEKFFTQNKDMFPDSFKRALKKA